MKNIIYVLFVFFLVSLCSCVTADNKAKKDVISNNSDTSAIENIMNRKSVRKYSDEKIEQEKIDTILKCAMAAPSAMNKQPWEILVVTEKEKLEKLAQIAPNASYSKNAQLAIIVCGDSSVSDKFWIQDCCAVTENILLAAESLGLGAVWCAVYPSEEKVKEIREFFNLPENVIPLNIIPMGYPFDKEEPKQKYNPEKVHLNNW